MNREVIQVVQKGGIAFKSCDEILPSMSNELRWQLEEMDRVLIDAVFDGRIDR